MSAFGRVLRGVRGGYRSVRRLEATVLLAGLVLSACVLVFVRVAQEVGERGGAASALDRWAFDALRDPRDPSLPRGPAWLRGLVRDVTALGSPGVLALAVAGTAGGLLLARRFRTAAFLAGASASGVLAALALKVLFARARPETASQVLDVASASFPSGHSMNAAIVYLTLGTFLAGVVEKRPLQVYVFAIGVLVALAVGVSRVWLGVHYATDVLAGWCAGFGWALAWWLAAEALSRRRAARGESG